MYYQMEKKWTKWYAMTWNVIAYRSKELLFGMHAFNCFLDDFNCVFTQIRCLSALLWFQHSKGYSKFFVHYLFFGTLLLRRNTMIIDFSLGKYQILLLLNPLLWMPKLTALVCRLHSPVQFRVLPTSSAYLELLSLLLVLNDHWQILLVLLSVKT